MKKVISSVLLCAGFTAQAAELPNFDKAQSPQFWITMGQDAMADLAKVGGKEFMMTSVAGANTSKGISIAQINNTQMNQLSRLMHTNHNRCGGYMVHDTLQSALLEQQQNITPATFTSSAFSEAATVNALLPNLNKANIVDTINYLSTNFTNRYYNTSHGTNASNGLKSRWQGIVSGKSWANATQVTHSAFAQKSVLVTLTGSEKPDEIVVIGGHLDSTIGNTSENSLAPGADDDASGIATLTEVMRVYVENNVQPKRTVKFYAYAAEEVGLRGSKDIADTAAANGDNVVGVMQLDMTNYDGSTNDITMMTDYTSATQNSYIASILDTYLPNISYGYDSCGYGCSDHASWTSAGYPASMPFETRMSQHNQRIHTTGDTLANMDSTGTKAHKFAQMALAYVIEMAADTATVPPTGSVLTNGVPATGLSASTGGDVNYTMDVPAGATNITFTMSGGTGDADMFTKLGSVPTSSVYDCRPYKSGNSESCSVTTTGKHYIRLNAYSAFSGVSLTGSYTEGGTGGLPDITGNDNNFSVAAGAWTHNTVDIPAGYGSLTVTMSGGSGDADLYVRHGSVSTTSNYDCRPYKAGNAESCTQVNPAAGTWYIDVRGYSSSSNVNLAWTATE